MESTSQTFHYSPLGWSIWLFGPLFIIGAIVIVMIWWTSLTHAVANSGITIHGIGDWLKAAMCHSYHCDTFDYILNSVLLFGFPLFASFLLFLGTLMMNSDRVTIVSSSSIAISRGSFIHWGSQSLTRSDVARIDVDSVPIIGVFGGSRATTMGTRWNVGITTKSSSGKTHRTIIALFSSKQTAESAMEQIQQTIK